MFEKCPPAGLVLGALGVAVSLLSDLSLYAILPTNYAKLSLDHWQVGMILSANRWVRLLTNHPASWLAARFPKHVDWMFTAALSLGVVCSLMYGLSSSFAILLTGRCLWGVSWSGIRLSALLCVRKVIEAGKMGPGLATGWYDGISRFGAVVGLFAGGPLFDLVGFHYLFLIWGAISLVSVPLGHFAFRISNRLPVPPADRSATPVEPGEPIGHHVPNTGRFTRCTLEKRFGLLVMGFTTGIVSWGLIVSTLGLIFEEKAVDGKIHLGATVSLATFNSAVLGTRWLGEVLGTPYLGHMSDGLGRRRHCQVFFALGAVCLGLCMANLPLGLLLALILLFFAAAAAVAIGSLTEAVSSGMITEFVTSQDLGSAVGPMLGWGLTQGGIPPRYAIFPVAMAFYLLGLCFCSVAFPAPPPAPEGSVVSDRSAMIELLTDDGAEANESAHS